MPTDDEFRRVAEDVRALARSLARDIRGAVERAHQDARNREGVHGGIAALGRAGRAGREELRRARATARQYVPRRPHHHRADGPWWPGPSPDRALGAAVPRWDGWAGRRYRDPSGVESPPWGRSHRADRASRHPPAAPLPALRHRHDGSTLLGLLAVVFGLAWLVASTRMVQVSAEAVLAVALMVLGGAMVVTARTDWALSRKSWPLLAGAALVAALIVSSASPSLDGGFRRLQFGSTTLVPTSWTAMPTHIEGNIGSTTLDLTKLPTVMPVDQSLTINGAVGRLLIMLPPALDVDLDGRIGLGRVAVDGGDIVGGFRQSFTRRLGPDPAPHPALALHVSAGLGSVVIDDGGAPAGPAGPKEPTPPTTPPGPPAGP